MYENMYSVQIIHQILLSGKLINNQFKFNLQHDRIDFYLNLEKKINRNEKSLFGTVMAV